MSREQARSQGKRVMDRIPFVSRPQRFDDLDVDKTDARFQSPLLPVKPGYACLTCTTLGLSLSRAGHRITEDICLCCIRNGTQNQNFAGWIDLVMAVAVSKGAEKPR